MKRISIIIAVVAVMLVASLEIGCTAKPDLTQWHVVHLNSSADSADSTKLNPADFVGYPRIKITGTMKQSDFFAIRSIGTIYHLDLSEVTIVGPIEVARAYPETPAVVQIGNAIPAGAFGSITILGDNAPPSVLPAHKSLRSIIFPRNLQTIGKNAFQGCGLNSQLDFPSTLSRIYDSAFNACGDLTGNLILPEDLIMLGGYAFNQCANLTGTLKIPALIDSISENAFSNCIGFSAIILPERLLRIGKYAFAASTIESLEFPLDITLIDQGAFRNCTELRGELSLPASIHTIGVSAFEYAGYDSRLVIPSSVKVIGARAFDSTKINRIDAFWDKSADMPVWDNSADWFPDSFEAESGATNNHTIYVPAGSLEAYNAHFAVDGKVFYNIKIRQ